MAENRLRRWREERGLTQRQLAEMAGTYQQQIEKLEKREHLTARWVQRLATALDLPTAALIGEVGGPPMVPVVGYVQAGDEAIEFLEAFERGGGMDEVEAPPGVHSGVAVRVRGNSMAPRFFDGDFLFYKRDDSPNLRDFYHRDCVVRLRDGRTMVKRVEPGSRPDHVTLRSYNPAMPLLADVAVQWIGPVIWVKPR